MSDLIGRRVSKPSVDSVQAEPDLSSPVFQESWPDLYKFLTIHRGSGQMASTGMLTMFIEQRRFKLCVNDRPNARSTFITGPSLTHCFGIADAGLRTGQLKWRQKGYKAPLRGQTSFLPG